jgi:hypothetical protein
MVLFLKCCLNLTVISTTLGNMPFMALSKSLFFKTKQSDEQFSENSRLFMKPLYEKFVLECICLEMNRNMQAPFWSAVVPESTVM